MSTVINFTAPVAVRKAQKRRSSAKYFLNCDTDICAHCHQRIRKEDGQYAVLLGNIVLHEEHYSEYLEDLEDSYPRMA